MGAKTSREQNLKVSLMTSKAEPLSIIFKLKETEMYTSIYLNALFQQDTNKAETPKKTFSIVNRFRPQMKEFSIFSGFKHSC